MPVKGVFRYQIQITRRRRGIDTADYGFDHLLFGFQFFIRINRAVLIDVDRDDAYALHRLAGLHVEGIVQVVVSDAERIPSDCFSQPGISIHGGYPAKSSCTPPRYVAQVSGCPTGIGTGVDLHKVAGLSAG